jgi:hypothetical protein
MIISLLFSHAFLLTHSPIARHASIDWEDILLLYFKHANG